jgi:hypothetical protein
LRHAANPQQRPGHLPSGHSRRQRREVLIVEVVFGLAGHNGLSAECEREMPGADDGARSSKRERR